jgi:hypothetical protein
VVGFVNAAAEVSPKVEAVESKSLCHVNCHFNPHRTCIASLAAFIITTIN